jgi:hypothetical protein
MGSTTRSGARGRVLPCCCSTGSPVRGPTGSRSERRWSASRPSSPSTSWDMARQLRRATRPAMRWSARPPTSRRSCAGRSPSRRTSWAIRSGRGSRCALPRTTPTSCAACSSRARRRASSIRTRGPPVAPPTRSWPGCWTGRASRRSCGTGRGCRCSRRSARPLQVCAPSFTRSASPTTPTVSRAACVARARASWRPSTTRCGPSSCRPRWWRAPWM